MILAGTKIRQAVAADHAAIDVVIEKAFAGRAEPDLVSALRLSGDIELELVAEAGAVIIGHILLSRLQSPSNCLALAPVSVVPRRQHCGIGSSLIVNAIDRARADGWAAIFLLGKPDYYRRFGFSADAASRFQTIYPKAYVMVAELQPSALKALDSDLVYAVPFRDLD